MLVAGLWVALVAGCLFLHENHAAWGLDRDIDQYLYSVRDFQRTGEMYARAPTGYIYPPLMFQVLWPLFGFTSHHTSAVSWFALNLAMLVAATALVARPASAPWMRRVVWGLPMLFLPVPSSLVSGQATIALYLLTVGGWVAYRRDRRALAGALLAAAAWIKFYPGLFGAYFLWKRDRRAVAGFVAGAIALLVVQFIGFGPRLLVRYFTSVLPPLLSTGQPEYAHSNLSVLGFSQQFFTQVPNVGTLVDSPGFAQVVRIGLTLALLAGTALVTRRRHGVPDRHRIDLEFSLVLLTALAIGSTLWIPSMVSVLLAVAVLLDRPPAGIGPGAMSRLVPVAVAIALIELMVVQLRIPIDDPEVRFSPFLLSGGFFAMMLLWWSTARQLAVSSRYAPLRNLKSR